MFDIKKDAELVDEVGKQLKQGKLTSIEAAFMRGLVQSLRDMEGAKATLNDVLATMDSKDAGIQQTDVHHGLWAFVTKVLEGKRLQA